MENLNLLNLELTKVDNSELISDDASAADL